MSKFENKYNTRRIMMKKQIHNLCTIGQDWYTNNIEIDFIPDKVIPDYIEVDKMIQNYEGKEMIIEEVIDNILQELKEYEPYYVEVKSRVEDAQHLPVEVWTEYYKETNN